MLFAQYGGANVQNDFRRIIAMILPKDIVKKKVMDTRNTGHDQRREQPLIQLGKKRRTLRVGGNVSFLML